MTGYGDGAPVYRAAGWLGVLPLPTGKKMPPPRGYTGWLGAWPTDEQVEAWQATRADGNLLLRLHDDTLALDVDAYDDKTGGLTIKEAESRWGPLPPTYRNSARPDDPVSGHLFYRVPEGFRSVGVLAFPELEIGDIELVQHHHRFVVCWPSVHPKTGGVYRWYGPDGEILPEGQVSSPEDLPELPQVWLDGLAMTHENKRRSTAGRKKPADRELPVYDVLRALTVGAPSEKVGLRLTKALYDLSRGQSRHDTMCRHVMGLMRFGSNGQSGVEFALGSLCRRFVEAVAGDRDDGEDEAAAEFDRFITGAGHLLDDGNHTDATDLEGFWELSDTLRHVRDFAHARLVGPWAVLGVLLARVLAVIPPTVQLPPWVGDNASLNLFVALVGLSGDGKGATEKAAKAAVRLGPVYSTGVGSGEGIGHLFAHYDRKAKETVMDRTSVYFSVPEVDTLGALKGRTGSTLLPQLRKAWDGSDLTFRYVDRTKSIVVGEHTYRLVMVVGVQPGRATTLLGDVDAGTPQRYLWLPSLAPDQPDEDAEAPEPLDLIATGVTQGWPGAGLEGHLIAAAGGEPPVHVLRFPEAAREEIRTNRKRKNRGESTDPALDGHLGLCRMKAAAALALLHGERKITSEFWEMSAVLMEMSRATRASVEARLAEKEGVVNRARGKAEGERSAVADEVRYDATVAKTAQKVLRCLNKFGNGTTGAVQQRLNSRYREYFEAALEALVEAGSVEVVGEEVRLVTKC